MGLTQIWGSQVITVKFTSIFKQVLQVKLLPVILTQEAVNRLDFADENKDKQIVLKLLQMKLDKWSVLTPPVVAYDQPTFSEHSLSLLNNQALELCNVEPISYLIDAIVQTTNNLDDISCQTVPTKPL